MARPTPFQRLPGFRDFPPEELAARAHIFEAWRRVARRHGFVEYDAPPLEPLELYTEKSGAEIVEQLYAFTDRGDRAVALRPEMTPSLARMLAERSRGLPKPIRWFSIPQLFRYERPQRGRLREHFQWNVDLVGEGSEGADAEILAVAIGSLRELGLGADDFVARISDRRLLSAVLAALGIGEDRLAAAYAIIDKVEREPRARSLDRLVAECGLAADRAEELLALLESTGLDALEARFAGDVPVREAVARLRGLEETLGALGLGSFLSFDLRIVRGLAYYTGVVFELFDRKGELRAICGGGRYDHLLERTGGEPLPAAGFGMGDVVLGELLRDRGLLPAWRPTVDWYVIHVSADLRTEALRIAGALRGRGERVVYPLRELSLRKQFAQASTEGARRVIVLGPEEWGRGAVRVRDMERGEEWEVTLAELLGGDA